MAIEKLEKIKPLWRSGTTQAARLLPELDPSHVRLMDLEAEDWLVFARNFAEYIPFFDTKYPEQVIGDWTRFFDSLVTWQAVPTKGTDAYQRLIRQIKSQIKLMESEANLAPHLSLFYAFLKLMDWPSKSMNMLTKRHLDFYYRDILRLEKKAAQGDRAFLILELAKINQVHIPEGTVFEGGKDRLGKKLFYRTMHGFSANQAKVVAIKNRCNDPIRKRVYFSQQADSLDGKGSEFPDKFPRWWPFGHPGLELARFGFILSNTHFRSPEGATRQFSVTFTFRDPLASPLNPGEITALMTADWTMAKGWMRVNPVINAGAFHSRCQGNTLQLAFLLSEALPSVVNADLKVHEGFESGADPLVRIGFPVTTSRMYDFLLGLSSNPCTSILVRSSVQGIRLPQIESDMGVLQAAKPFMPFSSYPKQGSSFYVQEPSWENKRVTNVSLEIKWANTSEDFRTLYFGYRNLTNQNFSKEAYVAQHFVANHASITNLKHLILTPLALHTALKESKVQVNAAPTNLLVPGDGYFTYDLHTREGLNWIKAEPGQRTLFSKEGGVYKTKLNLSSAAKLPVDKGIKLSLNQSFLHELFPRFYAMAMASEHPETLIPNEPYTPLAEEITLGYETSENFPMQQASGLRLFLFDDFGYFEESVAQKTHLPQSERRVFLASFPRLARGELFIQIRDLAPNQQLSLLFQVVDGSENPLNTPAATQNRTRWQVLIRNHWISLSSQQIIADGTDNLLKSGIIRFQLPETAFDLSSRMGQAGIWLRAVSTNAFDASCQLMNILPQALEVQFENRGNSLEHLAQGLPANSIAKMTERLAGVKSVLQPYNSFGGRPEEADTAFYIRVSERLRHKNRAVSLWDYEHLILEAFPDVYKAKCLNHTSPSSFMAPGETTLLVIPDTVDKNVFDRFQPRFSTGRLNEMRTFLISKISPASNLYLDNPVYEEVRIQIAVKFRQGFDPALHRNLLEQAIIGYLSPWAIRRENSIEFGVSLHESPFIYYLENLAYVAYISDLVWMKNGISVQKQVMPSSPRHILVSAKSHSITIIS
ncbi:MAG: baseplate J/gp47 family protein [Lunatimonas sp.]|uniref:baseplate J/gp47 family protein n=1 Tax=Lunatimonas sp. TaxID=2060141 RepID=UPI00263A6CC7|nr:baseplate J/gp47 family protein [Lunatimonas sp.]MCC5938903.1 baseplate J/gp47 family protein [Lunatimonas sp.]